MRRAAKRGTVTNGAPVNTPALKASSKPSSDVMRMGGSDLVISLPKGDYKRVQVIVDLELVPSLVSRLEHAASTFQRIRYRKLVFTVETFTSSAMAGGYIAAFIKDAADEVDQDQILEAAYCQQTKVAKKAWENARFAVSPPPEWYYIALEKGQGDPRLISPGRVVVVCTADWSQPADVNIQLDWQVELSMATLQPQSVEIKPPTIKPGKMLGILGDHQGLRWLGHENADEGWDAKTGFDFDFPPAADDAGHFLWKPSEPLSVYDTAKSVMWRYSYVWLIPENGKWAMYPGVMGQDMDKEKQVHSVPWLDHTSIIVPVITEEVRGTAQAPEAFRASSSPSLQGRRTYFNPSIVARRQQISHSRTLNAYLRNGLNTSETNSVNTTTKSLNALSMGSSSTKEPSSQPSKEHVPSKGKSAIRRFLSPSPRTEHSTSGSA